MKEFKIDTWWKKLLIYFCMIHAALFFVVMGLAIMFSVVSLFQTTENIDYEEYASQYLPLTEEEADKFCYDSCSLDGAVRHEIREDIAGDFLCGCYDEENTLTQTLRLGLE